MKINWWFVVSIVVVVGLIVYLEKPMMEVKRVEIEERVNVDEVKSEESQRVTMKKEGILSPELAGIAGYINAPDNFTLSNMVGKKVILIDIWTYSCINCQRTLPYLKAWYDRYSDKGLEIVGVHSPEFDFEKDIENVKRAVKKWNIAYPVVLDNDHATWDAFQNRYWPRKYLIDIDGYIAWDHIGEGQYAEAEEKIQELLKERMVRLGEQEVLPEGLAEVNATVVKYGRIETPEIYLGYAFTRGNFGSEEGLPAAQTVQYKLPLQLKPSQVYLEGTWYVDKDNVRLVSKSGRVVLKYAANKANIVAGSMNGSSINVLLDGLPNSNGDAIKNGIVEVRNDDLYNVADGSYALHTLELDIKGEGFKLYTFTFG